MNIFLSEKQGTFLPLPMLSERMMLDVQEEPPIPKLELNLANDSMEPMDPLDPTLCDPPATRKIPLWFHDTLRDAKRHVATR